VRKRRNRQSLNLFSNTAYFGAYIGAYALLEFIMPETAASVTGTRPRRVNGGLAPK